MALPVEDLEVERATHDDLPQLLEFIQALRKEDPGLKDVQEAPEETRIAVQTLLDHDSLGAIWVATAGGVPIGYVAVVYSYSLEFGGQVAFIDEIFVTPKLRRRGVGHRMLAVVEGFLRKSGIQAVLLEVSPRNTQATKLYRDLGFEERPYSLLQRWLIKRPSK